MSLIGQAFTAPTSHGCYIEGVVTNHNLTTNIVTLVDEDDFKWVGEEYMLENIDK